MEIQFLVTLDFDPETNKFKVVSQEQTKEKIKKTTTTKITVEETGEGIVILEDNKICLNQCAAQLLNIKPDDRVAIQYNKGKNCLIPIIASTTTLGVSTGNKLTKGLTVSFKGKANVELAKFGSRFTLEEIPNQKNVYILRGEGSNIETTTHDENILEISDLIEEDIPLDTKLDVVNEITFDEEIQVELADPISFML